MVLPLLMTVDTAVETSYTVDGTYEVGPCPVPTCSLAFRHFKMGEKRMCEMLTHLGPFRERSSPTVGR